ncbi:MAG: glycosyltransferase [Prevotella sp.]|nr:glycosyltransferase [Prevotella sp.]
MKFSITIPTFKSRYLAEAIQSVICQTYADWELIVVDDCSPEDIESVVAPWLSDSRIRYYRNDHNCGAFNLVDNWNICLSYCTGDYVICMGDDDRMLPCCLDEYAKLIGKYPNLNVYHARTEIINENGEVVSLQEPRPEWESMLSLIWNRWAHRDLQFIGDFCYRRQHLTAEGGYYKLPLAWGSDDVTAARAARSQGIANTQVFCFQYRQNNQTISSSTSHAKTKLLATLQQYDWFDHLLSALSTEQLSADDGKHFVTIEAPRRSYYTKSFGKDIIDGVRGNPLRLRWYYRQLKPLHFPTSTFLRWYLSSLYHLFA